MTAIIIADDKIVATDRANEAGYRVVRFLDSRNDFADLYRSFAAEVEPL